MQSKKVRLWAGVMAQGVKALAAKPAGLNLIPKIHMVEGEKRLLQVVFCLQTHTMACTPALTDMRTPSPPRKRNRERKKTRLQIF